jgi:hypothetical protein
MISCRNVLQITVRIDRTARKVLISRDFVLAVLSWGIDRQWTVTDRHGKYRPPIDRQDLLRLQVFHPLRGPRGRCGRYLDGLYGYISLMLANGACYQIISRG